MGVQGMNFIAGCLLLFMDEEDTFWCLAIIVEELLPGYYSMAMVEPQVRSPLACCIASCFPHNTVTALHDSSAADGACHGLQLSALEQKLDADSVYN